MYVVYKKESNEQTTRINNVVDALFAGVDIDYDTDTDITRRTKTVLVDDYSNGPITLENICTVMRIVINLAESHPHPEEEYIHFNIPKKTGGMGKKNGQECRALTNVWYDISPIVPWSPERNGHPTQKPLQLMERCVTIWTNEGDTILDFTMGSGTTGEACVNLRRNFIGIESDKQWFDVADKRINK